MPILLKKYNKYSLYDLQILNIKLNKVLGIYSKHTTIVFSFLISNCKNRMYKTLKNYEGYTVRSKL